MSTHRSSLRAKSPSPAAQPHLQWLLSPRRTTSCLTTATSEGAFACLCSVLKLFAATRRAHRAELFPFAQMRLLLPTAALSRQTQPLTVVLSPLPTQPSRLPAAASLQTQQRSMVVQFTASARISRLLARLCSNRARTMARSPCNAALSSHNHLPVSAVSTTLPTWAAVFIWKMLHRPHLRLARKPTCGVSSWATQRSKAAQCI